MTDEQLKAAIGGGVLAWIAFSIANVLALAGAGFVVAVVAAIVLFSRRSRRR